MNIYTGINTLKRLNWQDYAEDYRLFVFGFLKTICQLKYILQGILQGILQIKNMGSDSFSSLLLFPIQGLAHFGCQFLV